MTKLPLQDGTFSILTIHRDELLEAGFDGRQCTNDDMEIIAASLADIYSERLFNQDLPLIAEDLGVPMLSVKTALDIIEEAGARSVPFDTKRRFGEQYYTMCTKGHDYWLEVGCKHCNRVDLYIGEDLGLPNGTRFRHEFE